jgi:hypothetical protein
MVLPACQMAVLSAPPSYSESLNSRVDYTKKRPARFPREPLTESLDLDQHIAKVRIAQATNSDL